MFDKTLFEKYPLLILQISGWSTYLIADWLNHFKDGHYFLLPSFISTITAIILTGSIAVITNKMESRGRKIQSVVFISTLLLGAALWNKLWSISHGEYQNYTEMFSQYLSVFDYSLMQWVSTGYYPLFLFLAWGGFFLGSKWFFELKVQQQLVSEAQVKTKQAQLQTLRYQLNPHFLFNVLNNIDVSILSDDKATAHQMVQHLSSFLRNSLQQGEQDKITIRDELHVVRDFINIEQVRFGDAIAIEVSIDAQCDDAMLPPMLLQPLVENAIKFAWSQSEQGKVAIKITKQSSKLSISIGNSRAQMKETVPGTGTGLRNTQERISLVYGQDASLTVHEKHNFYQVNILLPWEVEVV